MKLTKLVQTGIILSALAVSCTGMVLLGIGRPIGLPYAIAGVLVALAAWGGWSAVEEQDTVESLSHLTSELVSSAKAETVSAPKK